MDEFHLDMGVRFTPDENSVKEIDKLFDSFRKIKVFGGDENIAKMREQFDDYNTRRSSLQQAQSMLDQYRAAQGKGDKFEAERFIGVVSDNNRNYLACLILGSGVELFAESHDVNTLRTKCRSYWRRRIRSATFNL